MPKTYRFRLSAIMFLHYFAAGATLPLMSLYFSQELGFGGAGAGLILSLSALSAMLAPLLSAFVSDRVLSAERLFALAEALAAFFMLGLALSSHFLPVIIFYLLYMGMFISAMALSNVIVFHHSPDGGRSFGGVRLWGTVGWVVSGWIFGFFYLRLSQGTVGDALFFTAGVSLFLSLFSLSLPGQKGKAPRRSRLLPDAALKLFMRPELLLLGVTAFLMQITHKFYYFGAAPYLRHLGFSDAMILPSMSLGQAMEVVSMLLLPFLFKRFPPRRIILFGTIMELSRFSIFAFGSGGIGALAGIAFHGPSFAFFFTVSFIYLNGFADTESRAGVQQLFFFIVEGMGSLAGSLLAGFSYDLNMQIVPGSFRLFWMIPTVLTLFAISIALLINRMGDRREFGTASIEA
jgi:MFS family permease